MEFIFDKPYLFTEYFLMNILIVLFFRCLVANSSRMHDTVVDMLKAVFCLHGNLWMNDAIY